MCSAVQPAQAREPLMVHEIPKLPWSKIATDLFVFNGENYIVIVDYYSELEQVKSTTAQPVIQDLKVTFTRHGVPECVISNNGLAMHLRSSRDLQNSGSSSMWPPLTPPAIKWEGRGCSQNMQDPHEKTQSGKVRLTASATKPLKHPN